jgi:release factor glutamine methyltransferase
LTIRAALEWAQGSLDASGIQDSQATAQWLLAEAVGFSRFELPVHYDVVLTDIQLATLRRGVERRASGEPLQYIFGRAPFRRLELTVRRGVLIPRPETEVLVGIVIDELQKTRRSAHISASQPAQIVDLCTGTGCIALSLLHECSYLHVVATDIDSMAVELARENAHELGLDTNGGFVVLKDDLAASLLADEACRGSFDVVVSNPPYVPTAELDELPVEIADYEPKKALDGGVDGLTVFRRIVEEATVLLNDNGLLACELHEKTLEDALRICQEWNYTDVMIHPDLTGKPRIVTARRAVL